MKHELLVERVDPSELDTIARVLAEAYTEDPIHLWAMPKAATRLKQVQDGIVFFTLFLRWMRKYSWDVFANADRSAVSITWPVRQGESGYPSGVRYLPTLVRTKSPVNDYFAWIEKFRPKVDHQYSEFLAALPGAPRGAGFFLLANVLKMFDRVGLPVWAWSSNPLNLVLYRRLGFEIGETVRMDDNSPPVTPIWHPPVPQTDEAGKP